MSAGVRACALLATALASACGDDRPRDALVEAVGGTRLAPTWIAYDDGARQLVPDQLYDRHEHTPCAPAAWRGGALRCVPIAAEAVYVDAACTEVVGRASGLVPPTHFLLHERVDGAVALAHVYRAGAPRSPIGTFYERRDGACVGPFTADPDRRDVTIASEVAVEELAALVPGEIGGGRIAVTVLTSDDGLRLPTTLRDRELDATCTPSPEPDGVVRCRPVAAATSWFSDDACRHPVAVVEAGAPAPPVLEVVEPDGCPRYYRVGSALPGPFYRRDGDFCQPVPIGHGARAYDAGAAIALAELHRTVEDVPRRRLQRIVLGADDVEVTATRMYDAAIAADCTPAELGDGVRCLPASIATTTTLFVSPRCVAPIDVAILPQRTCAPVRFARAAGAAPDQLRTIGDAPTTPLYQHVPGACFPYQPAPGRVPFALGPVLPADVFVGGVRFGER